MGSSLTHDVVWQGLSLSNSGPQNCHTQERQEKMAQTELGNQQPVGHMEMLEDEEQGHMCSAHSG